MYFSVRTTNTTEFSFLLNVKNANLKVLLWKTFIKNSGGGEEKEGKKAYGITLLVVHYPICIAYIALLSFSSKMRITEFI